jgi:hypothetical protein
LASLAKPVPGHQRPMGFIWKLVTGMFFFVKILIPNLRSKVPTIIEELYMETALDSHYNRQAKFQNTLRKIKSRVEHSVPCL